MRIYSLIRRRPSPAAVMSAAALFMSLGGVGYAATQIPNGSVGTAQLAKGAVTNSKIRDNAVSYNKIAKNTVGIHRINAEQVQARVGETCAAGSAIGTIEQVGKVKCNPALPFEFGTSNNSASVATTATSPTSVTTVSLPSGASYLAFANPTVTVTSTSVVQHVSVSCTLTVGSNTAARAVTIDTTGTAGTTSSGSIPLQAAGLSGTAGVSCQSSTSGGGAAPVVSVTSAINAIQTAGNS